VSDNRKDAFISYGRADAEWVRVLAENLYQSGLELFFDEWDIGPGDVLVHKLDQGILTSRNGVLVVSPESLSRPWVQNEYAAMMTRVVAGKQTLIPVLLKDAEMPPLLAARLWVDFRNADGPDYDARLRELARTLKGERPGPPDRTGVLQPPPNGGFRATGTQALHLSIGVEQTKLSGGGIEASGPRPEPGFDSGALNWTLERSRTHAGPVRDDPGGAGAHVDLESTLEDAGDRLAAAFLPREVSQALAGAVAEAERLNNTLQLALAISEPFADLPWETLGLPGIGALALHPRVALFRQVGTEGAAPAVSIPGPLRILVAIGSPEAQNRRGELLDMEAETARILDATDAAQRSGRAFVRILECGGVDAIHAALAERRYHILHISCHATQGQLILEDAHGQEDRVTAKRLWEKAIPAERSPPLVVLAGCSTGRDETAEDAGGEGRLPGLARSLAQHGVPAVIAMQASVSDRYATELMGEVYAALSSWEAPHALAALNHARRTLEARRREDASPVRPPPEWATPAFFCAATPLTLYDPTAKPEKLEQPSTPVFDAGVVVRRIGDMVGRRSEQRRILRSLRDPTGAGVVIHGIGGVGKSTLAAQILHRLAGDNGFLLVSVARESNPDRVFGAIGTRLLTLCLELGGDEKHPLRQLAGALGEPKIPWRARFEALAQMVLANIPLVFLFDNFEDNLQGDALPTELGELLALWLQRPEKSRLLFTSRHPFKLPDDAHDRLLVFPLGPLSWAETRKLFLRLDGIKTLEAKDQRRAYEEVGGHPRALEYLDAILRGGKAKFADMQKRLRDQLAKQGITDPSRWCADTAGGLDAALAATVTLAADDVLLDQLLAALDDHPLARRLIFAASVYRIPVDEIGLYWLVGEPVERAPDPARQARLEAMSERLQEARKTNPVAGLGDVASEEELRQFESDRAAESAPPVRPLDGFSNAKEKLIALSLLARARFAEDEADNFVVHRWTAGALAKRMSDEQARTAHGAAAACWRWRVSKRPQSREQDIADLLEARHHYLALGDRAEFYGVSVSIVEQLDTWGAWEWEKQLIEETLAHMPENSREAAGLLHQLGIVAENRGDYDAALEWYRKSLAIKEQLGDRQGIATSYHQLGRVAGQRGDYDAALDWYRKSLAIAEQLGDRRGMAASYHQLGRVAENRGDYDAALDWYRKSLAIAEQLGARQGMAASYHQLGRVAEQRGDYDTALDWYRKSLAIEEQLGNRQGMANSYGQLGNIAYLQGDYDGALDRYRKALAVFEQLGDRAGMANTYHQLGMVAQDRGDYDAALDWYRKSLAIKEQLGDRAGMANTYHQLGMVAQDRGDYDAAFDWYRKSLVIAEQLGDRAGMANSYGQLGNLYMGNSKAPEAVPFTLRSLGLHLELGAPEARIDLFWLSRERQALGATAFSEILSRHLDPESVADCLAMIDDFERRQSQHEVR
jgi:tetratricopeptide (TPR) repeat protein